MRALVKKFIERCGYEVQRTDSDARLRRMHADQELLEQLETGVAEDPSLRAFLEYVITHPSKGTSRLLTDRVAHFFCGSNATFLEVGAWDPLLHSDTYWLESEHGWRGVQVEANATLAKKLRETRNSVVVEAALVSSSDHSYPHYFHAGPAGSDTAFVSRSPSQKPVITTTFTELRSHYSSGCDALFLDIEGSELPVIMDDAFNDYGFQFACVETIWNGQAIRSAMVQRGYTEKWRYLSGYNSWFVKEQ